MADEQLSFYILVQGHEEGDKWRDPGSARVAVCVKSACLRMCVALCRPMCALHMCCAHARTHARTRHYNHKL